MKPVLGILTLGICWAALFAPVAVAQAPPQFQYREFELGSNLASIARLIGAEASKAKVIHSRPSVLKDLEWRPRYRAGSESTSDPVDLIVFRFYDDRLYMMVVDYDRRRTAGMNSTDMIAAVTETYGAVSQIPSRPMGAAGQYSFPDTPLGVWGDETTTISLLRVAYPESFRLVVASRELQELARVAGDTAVRLDKEEAPQRELDRQKREATDSLAASEKLKNENKATFKP